MNEVPEVTARPSGFPKTWIVLGLLVLAHAGFGAYLSPVVRSISGDRIVEFLTGGAILSQPILFAIWAALARQRFYHRFLWSLLLCTLVSFSDELGALRHGHSQVGVFMLLDLVIQGIARPVSQGRIGRGGMPAQEGVGWRQMNPTRTS